MTKVLFVCLGNICRSPLAEGIFRDLIEKNKLTETLSCDSAGTSNYHIGELPDRRTRQNAQAHGITLTSRARQVTIQDFEQFDYILAADQSNYENLLRLQTQSKQPKAKLLLMRAFDNEATSDQNVPDPYYGNEKDFEEVYQIVLRSMKGLLNFLQTKH